MKRVVLSNSQLEQVLSLRQNGLSWVKIQRETGIPRRIARRDYEESQQRQLESARKDVAAQEYRLHLDLLWCPRKDGNHRSLLLLSLQRPSLLLSQSLPLRPRKNHRPHPHL